MSHVEILVPFGLPPAELAPDLIRQLQAPALATLAARAASSAVPQPEEAFQRTLPHERWLSARCGLQDPRASNNSPQVAPSLMPSYGLEAGQGLWFVLQPVHIHIARDHLVLTDPRRLELDDNHARLLFDIAAPLFSEAGLALAWGDAGTWFLRADAWAGLQTATPDAATGHNIDIWMPAGEREQARAWRKIQNEVQMHWFGHALNDEREARGLQPVNSLWLWGGAQARAGQPGVVYSHACNLHGWYAAFRRHAGEHLAAQAAHDLPREAPRLLVLLDQLSGSWLGGDWGSWLAGMQELEANWFAPMLSAVKSGAHRELTLLLTDDTRMLQLNVSRGSLRKFWRKPDLAPLLPPAP